MRRTGKVISVDEQTLRVCFSRLEACDSCNLCGEGRKDTTVSVRGQAQVGDLVEVEMPGAQVVKVAMLAYALPLLALILGLFLGSALFAGQELAVMAGGLICLLLSLLLLKLLDGKLGLKARWQPRLVAVLDQEDGQQA